MTDKNTAQSLIQAEETKLATLMTQVALCKKRIATLKTLYPNETGGVSKRTAKSTATKTRKGRTRIDSGKLTQESFNILKFIGTDGRSMAEILAFCEQSNIKTNAVNMRGMLRYWSSRYQWIESARHGIHRLSAKGLARLTQPLIPDGSADKKSEPAA